MNKSKSYLLILTLLSFFSSDYIFAQTTNLISNSGFELFKKLPTDVAQAKDCMISWVIPNDVGKGEYYHQQCSTKKAGTQKNHFGEQNPHSGQAYVGLCIAKNFREYLQTELKSSLIKGEKYTVKLYISCADKGWLSTVSEFNILFSKGSFSIPENENLQVAPEIKFTGDFSHKKDWIELSTTYTANGTEKFMTFGSFVYKDKGEIHGEINGAFKYAHYYVDDIFIGLEENKKPPVQDSIHEKANTVDTSINLTVGDVYVLHNLQFESGKSILLPNEYPELENFIRHVEKYPNQTLLVTGHTDNVGNKGDNKMLSLERANAIKQYLVAKGINKNKIVIEGKGDEIPLDSNETEEGRKKNRRVEISIIK
ncbi:OmpA family protein [Fluviicola taffensis]|uniref:OmpA/MotB domain protein n=1 Tax=Fluviicola taffensis (strain DSM 16823 / NCIMB 13979 / RW262) TaxID=755732 RepID=F2ICH0_FLUTR|nr:OmpA family protein [Fluviicola taffensis]AEA45440.1 OmpA/MotB domain protein [Fluviicola taffensis DSM 16823]